MRLQGKVAVVTGTRTGEVRTQNRDAIVSREQDGMVGPRWFLQ